MADQPVASEKEEGGDRSPPLTGVRVLEWAEGIPGPTAGWLLAECGAEVLKVEHPAGDPYRESLGFQVLNRGKLSVVLDLESGDDRERFRRYAAAADVVLVDDESRLERAGIGYDRGRWPSLVWCSAPAFPDGPEWKDLPARDALLEAAGGLSAMQWAYAASPVHFVTPMASYATGFLAALGIAAALRARALTGRGQRVVTSGMSAAMLLQSGTYVRGPTHEGSLAGLGSDPRGVFPTYAFYETADGWIFVGALTDGFWTSLATLVGAIDLLTDPDLPTTPLALARPETRAQIRGVLEPIFRAETTAEWLRRFEENDIPGGRVQSRRDALDEPNAAATGAVIEIDDPDLGTIRQAGPPILFSGSSSSPSPAPPLDADVSPSFARRATHATPAPSPLATPLAGIRVLDLTNFIAGPLCPMLLADLGADVVKVESASGDPFRFAAFGFEGWNRGKRSLVLDLKSAAGAAAFRRLAAGADVVVENFRPGVLDRLGLGEASLRALNPRLVYTAVSGFGATGPESSRPGFDPVMQARSGFSRAQGGDGEPVLHQVAYTDYMTGTLAAFATAAALAEREETGQGRRVDLSLYRTSFAMQAGEIVECGGRMPPAPGGRDLLGVSAAERAYPARDGWVTVAARDLAEARALVGCLDLDVDAERVLDAGPTSKLAEDIAARTARRARASLLRDLRAAGVPAAPCRTLREVFESPELRAAGLICEVEHPTLGRLTECGPFLRIGDTAPATPRPGPALGAHGRAVLAEAGFSQAEIDALVAAGVTR